MDENTQRIWGVDFSAAKSDAGRKTWIADCCIEDERLVVNSLENASKHFDLGTNGRDSVFEGLVEGIAALDDSIVAMDFPFGLPQWVLEQDDWESFVEATPDQWGVLDGVGDPKSLHGGMKERAGETDCCLRRATDAEHGGQNPTGFRIKTQTYYGISAVLKPLTTESDVVVRPFQADRDSSTTVVETYPAAVFHRLGAARQGYKSDDHDGVTARRYNLAKLEQHGLEVGAADADCAIGTDDALDALAAAYGAWVARDEIPGGTDERHMAEGRIYAGKG